MDALPQMLSPQVVGDDLFRVEGSREGWRGLYGGRIIAQALGAALKTVPADRPVHSLHAYFVRAGAFDIPLDLEVTRDRDGGSFSSRRVVVRQADNVILSCAASFHCREAGPAHQWGAAADIPEPESLESSIEHSRKRGAVTIWVKPPFRHFDIRPVAGFGPVDPAVGIPNAAWWFRYRGPPIDAAAMHGLLLAYASDMFMLTTALQPHREAFTGRSHLASLDHSIWFHADVRMDRWMLFRQVSPWAGTGRGLSFGHFFDREGTLVATVGQEGLMRLAGYGDVKDDKLPVLPMPLTHPGSLPTNPTADSKRAPGAY